MEFYKMMFKSIKQAYIVLLSFSGSLASINNIYSFTACISLNNQSCMTSLLLMIQISIDIIKDYVTSNIDVMKILILLMIDLVKYL